MGATAWRAPLSGVHDRHGGRPFIADEGRLRPARAEDVERAARSARARVPRHIATIAIAVTDLKVPLIF